MKNNIRLRAKCWGPAGKILILLSYRANLLLAAASHGARFASSTIDTKWSANSWARHVELVDVEAGGCVGNPARIWQRKENTPLGMTVRDQFGWPINRNHRV